jgi:hypothetical protein
MFSRNKDYDKDPNLSEKNKKFIKSCTEFEKKQEIEEKKYFEKIDKQKNKINKNLP